MCEAARLHGLAVFACVDEGGFILACAQPEQFFRLPQSVGAQFVEHERRKSDSARTTRLRLLIADSVSRLLGALDDG